VHSQLVPLPFVPPRIARELDAFARGCALCTLDGTIIAESGAFVWLVPSATWMPYQQWIVPRAHVTSLREADLRELAPLLQRATAATRKLGDFNVVFMNFPHGSAGHFYIEVLPRVTTIAGLELGTGTFVEIIEPAAAARRLRT
jgi:UDPglucose--hexose-1-phosphate uridylyltransferase